MQGTSEARGVDDLDGSGRRSEDETVEQLRLELAAARQRIAELESRNGICGGTETALEEKEAELRAIVDALPDLIIRLRRDGLFLDVKSPSQEVLTLPVEAIVGRNIHETGLPAEVVEVHLRSMRMALRSAGVQTFEYQLQVPRGQRDFEARAVACGRDEVLLIIRDVTEPKKATAEKRSLEGELHQARKMESIGRMAGGVAHNLNNLLAPIFGYAEMLLADAPATGRSRDYLRTILKAADGARDLTRQLLAISHKQLPAIRRLDLRQVVAGFGKILRRAIRENIDIEFRQSADPVIVEADVSQLEQILLNLAINAQDAMPSGGHMDIETASLDLAQGRPGVRPGRYGRLRISDNGSGIDTSIREKIFEPFFTTKEPGKGTGLGLATVQAIVEQHGGDLQLETALGRGSTFEILLPYGDGTAASLRSAPQLQPAPLEGGSETVLVAEDNEMVNRLVCRILRRYGYEVLTAGDGAQCLRLAQRHPGPIDLLLADVVMPKINGPELHARLRALSPALKVLYMSGYADEVIVDHGVERGDAHLIEKPFSIPNLLQKVRQALADTV